LQLAPTTNPPLRDLSQLQGARARRARRGVGPWEGRARPAPALSRQEAKPAVAPETAAAAVEEALAIAAALRVAAALQAAALRAAALRVAAAALRAAAAG